jgi:hypothetical protein
MNPINRRLLNLEAAARQADLANGKEAQAVRQVTQADLDALFDAIQGWPPWPKGTISMETTPELCTVIHEALREAIRASHGGQESHDHETNEP